MKYSLIIFFLALTAFSCTDKKTEKPKPAEVTSAVKESDLTTIILTDKAISRLGIEIYTVNEKELGEVFKTGGQAMAAPGNAVSIISPLQGTLVVPAGQEPQPGKSVKKGQILYRVVILPAEKDMISVREEVKSRSSQLENAKTQSKRISELLSDGAVSVKQNEQAQDNLTQAQQLYNDAQARYSLLRNGSSGNVGNNATYAIEAPIDGIIQQVYVGNGQAITAGMPILDLAAITPLWIKVPIYSGDVSKLSLSQPAILQKLGSQGTGTGVQATMASSPVTSNNSSLTDIFFVIENMDDEFMPGERVNVSLSKKTTSKNMIVPYNAVLYDYNGGEWVYVRTKTQTFVRTRINIDHVSNGMAVIAKGLKLGDEVVTAGAPELFGTEFNSGK